MSGPSIVVSYESICLLYLSHAHIHIRIILNKCFPLLAVTTHPLVRISFFIATELKLKRLPFIHTIARTEISRRLTSQPSQNPGTLRGPGLLNVSSRSTVGRRGAPGGRALAHVCLTCAPPHARQPPPPPPLRPIGHAGQHCHSEGPRSVPQVYAVLWIVTRLREQISK